MPEPQGRYSKEEFARRGDEFYERFVRPLVEEADERKFVAIDIETGDYEIDTSELEASDRLLGRHPGAQVWVTRAGSRYVRRFESRRRLVTRSEASVEVTIQLRGIPTKGAGTTHE